MIGLPYNRCVRAIWYCIWYKFSKFKGTRDRCINRNSFSQIATEWSMVTGNYFHHCKNATIHAEYVSFLWIHTNFQFLKPMKSKVYMLKRDIFNRNDGKWRHLSYFIVLTQGGWLIPRATITFSTVPIWISCEFLNRKGTRNCSDGQNLFWTNWTKEWTLQN